MSIQGEPLDDAFQELARINRWLGGCSTSLEGINSLVIDLPRRDALSILDVGAGGADIVDAVQTKFANVSFTAFDLNQGACRTAAKRHPSITVVQGSVFALPFQDQSFDIIHVSLFLHHFTEQELHGILRTLMNAARYGIVINDLRRSLFAYIGISILTRLFSRSAMVKNDGPLSVRKGFTKMELTRLCMTLSPNSFSIRRKWAYRWLVCLKKVP